MSTADDVAWCPLAFGYANYARPGFRDHLVLAAPPPAGNDGVPRGTLGGAGLAVSAASAFFRDTLRALDAAVLRPRHDGFLTFQETAGDLLHRHLRLGGDPDRVL